MRKLSESDDEELVITIHTSACVYAEMYALAPGFTTAKVNADVAVSPGMKLMVEIEGLVVGGAACKAIQPA